MSIHDLPNKIKSKIGIDNTTFLHLLLIVGVGVAAFGFGRLSAINKPQNTDISITGTANAYTATNPKPQAKTSSISTEKNYVASKNGKLYYTVGCKGANRIKDENKVYFATSGDAEKSGYTASSSC